MTSDGERAVIARANLCDHYFDRLVIETSRMLWQRSQALMGGGGETSSEMGQVSSSPSGGGDKSSLGSQPKRPMNAFMVWGQTVRRELHQRYSNVQNALLSKALGRVWRNMAAAEKEPYIRRANLIKVNHKREFPNYRYQPRRVQERRNNRANSMLIGINLNHPVNQQPHLSSSAAAAGLLAAEEPLGDQLHHHHHHHQHHNQDQLYQQHLYPKCGKFLRGDSVQTFEYYPYPLTGAGASSNQAGPGVEQQLTSYVAQQHVGANYVACPNDSYHHQHHHHQHHHQQQQQQQQPPAPPPQQQQQSEPSVVYQSYQQFAYSNNSSNSNNNSSHHQQHHYHHQPQQHQQQSVAPTTTTRLAYVHRSHHQGYGIN